MSPFLLSIYLFFPYESVFSSSWEAEITVQPLQWSEIFLKIYLLLMANYSSQIILGTHKEH